MTKTREASNEQLTQYPAFSQELIPLIESVPHNEYVSSQESIIECSHPCADQRFAPGKPSVLQGGGKQQDYLII